MGTIQFDRKNGKEVWEIKHSDFSISPNQNKYKVNIWVSAEEVIEKLADTGDTPTMIEVVYPISEIPIFSEIFKFKMPKYEEVQEDWDEDKDYYCNWYYYEHRDVENIEIEIQKIALDNFKIQITGAVEDPIWKGELETKLTIKFESKLSHVLDGCWAE